MSDTPSSSDRRPKIVISRILAVLARVSCLLLCVTGFLLCSAKIAYGDVVALVGTALLGGGALDGFALSRRLELDVTRARARDATHKLEEIQDAHWQLSD